jgi:hypothetical protein
MTGAGGWWCPVGRKHLSPSRGIGSCAVVRCILLLLHTPPGGAFRSFPLQRHDIAPPPAVHPCDAHLEAQVVENGGHSSRSHNTSLISELHAGVDVVKVLVEFR